MLRVGDRIHPGLNQMRLPVALIGAVVSISSDVS